MGSFCRGERGSKVDSARTYSITKERYWSAAARTTGRPDSSE